jgi:hypothetical protein
MGCIPTTTSPVRDQGETVFYVIARDVDEFGSITRVYMRLEEDGTHTPMRNWARATRYTRRDAEKTLCRLNSHNVEEPFYVLIPGKEPYVVRF